MYNCSNGLEQHTRTSVPVPSTCTKEENQVLFKKKNRKSIKDMKSASKWSKIEEKSKNILRKEI